MQPGMRVRVPFGRQQQIGVVVALATGSEFPLSKLKAAHAVIDEVPALPPELLEFTCWAARYYHHPVGEALATALPVLLRQGEQAVPHQQRRWHLTDSGRSALESGALSRAPTQRALAERLAASRQGLIEGLLLGDTGRQSLRALEQKGYAAVEMVADFGLIEGSGGASVELNADQAAASEAIAAHNDYACYLLDGITGSGKTEVYLSAIEQTLARGEQALVLVPEIGLTPQLVERFARRFATPIALLHSGLNERERLNAWLAARSGEAAIVIGTRSAIFTPLARPGLIVVDEEHDPSFKQQDGFRYCARDLAVVRASRLGIPVVLGSATPSLESLYNVQRGRYTLLRLRQRAGGATLPSFRLLDIRSKTLEGGLSQALLERVQTELGSGGQVLLFLNRRGFAPTLICHECGWVAACSRCDARLTLHQGVGRLRCHHCGHERRILQHCPDCRSLDLRPLGQGTERVEQVLEARFPGHRVLRIDRDSTRRKGAMARLLDEARRGEGHILLGTQMLAKGHDLPDIGLVGILDADQGLFGSDFRASERLAQLVTQVAGRAGRAQRRGEVIIQTRHPEHPLLHLLLERGYEQFAEEILREREVVGLPPYTSLAVLRAEAVDPQAPLHFLEVARDHARQRAGTQVELLGPVPAPMERRAGRYRAQLLLQAAERRELHRLLAQWVPQLHALKAARKVRYSIDVDPYEML